MPGSTPTLHVAGKVTCPTGGHTARLVPAMPQGINPSIYLLDLVVTPPAPDQIVTQAIADVDVHYVEQTNTSYDSVEIQPESLMVNVEVVV